MTRPTLVLINGAPGTGKTTLSKRLAAELSLPLVSRDDLKLVLFDACGWQEKELRTDLIHASFELFHLFVETQLKAGVSLIAETAFTRKWDAPRILDLRTRCDFSTMQIICKTEFDILFRRFMKRNDSGTLHPAFVNRSITYEEYRKSLEDGKYQELDIGCTNYEIDTTDFETIDYPRLFETTSTIIASG